jgi:TP901-1 family phage major tail protein
MAIEKGSAFLLKVNEAGTFSTVAGLRTTGLTINNEPINVTHKGSGGWRELLSGGGVRSVSLSAAGIFTNAAAETRVRTLALSGASEDVQVVFEASDKLVGRFVVTKLDYAGDYNGERTYAMTLESAGVVSFVP